ncbi:hypothetical protein C8R46DRAFT_1023912 [Mycena filopes]|nr:hypothetical protein C8R46DRAFT_1023912 [Mycena filopes]
MNRMPGELSTPPPSPGKQLTLELPPEQTPTKNLEKPKLTISTSPMNGSLASLACATRLSPNTRSPSGNRTDPIPNDVSSSAVLTPELIAVGELVAAMKRVLGTLGTTFDSLGEQTERVATLAPALKAADQIKKLRAEIAHVTQDQRIQALEVENLLQEAVKQTLSVDLKAHIQERVAREVKDRLNVQIPENLRQQIKFHKRQILEVQRSLHNSSFSEARQHNSTLGPAALTDELRPLLRPLPSAEQSPSVASIPPTPDTTSGRDDTAPTASPLFPRDLKALFALKSEEAQTLVKEYRLGEQAMSTTPIAAEGAVSGEPDVRARNLNKFMAHIGVVGYQMHVFPACTSSSPEDQSMRSTLIIRVHPSI